MEPGTEGRPRVRPRRRTRAASPESAWIELADVPRLPARGPGVVAVVDVTPRNRLRPERRRQVAATPVARRAG